jgi:hypothetical protein
MRSASHFDISRIDLLPTSKRLLGGTMYKGIAVKEHSVFHGHQMLSDPFEIPRALD